MIKKGLQIICDWNPTVILKFGMVDFDEKEMNVLDELLPDIKAFSCSSILNSHGMDGQINLNTG